MAGGSQPAGERAVVYCVVPWQLAAKLHDSLVRHFRDDPAIEVVVERRGRGRRAGVERRVTSGEPTTERRTVRNVGGRRVAERRAATEVTHAPPLPRKARPFVDRLTFLERIEPSEAHEEAIDSARLVIRWQGGDRDAFAELYLRYFHRVFTYLRIALSDDHEAEDATQQVFINALEALPRYERRSRPFAAWLFTIVRNQAINRLRHQDRVRLLEPSELDRHRVDTADDAATRALTWITDRELLMLVERLPASQRQVLVLRFMMQMTVSEAAGVLGTTPNHVSVLQYRALGFLGDRLKALGREAQVPSRDRARLVRCPRQARVLRRRRFALAP